MLLFLLLFTVLWFTSIFLAYQIAAYLRTHWKRRNVLQKWTIPLFHDNLFKMFGLESYFNMVIRLYNQFPAERYSGYYQLGRPVLLIRDPDLIKTITVTDFEHFSNHRHIYPVRWEPVWSKNLYALKGEKWRKMRAILDPGFSNNKLRSMFWLMNECAMDLRNYIKKELELGPAVYEMQDLFTRYANDVISICALGFERNSLREPDNDIYKIGLALTELRGLWKSVGLYLVQCMPYFAKLLRIRRFSKKATEQLKSIIISDIMVREHTNLERVNLLNLQIKARKGNMKDAESVTGISNLDIAAQSLIFFTAGFETVSTTMIFMSYELALNPHIQRLLQREIDNTQLHSNGRLMYKSLDTMKYMDMVISETLRKWPSAVAVDRICVKPYTIQPTRPNEAPVYLEKGSDILVPIIGIHRDPQYFPEPDKFDPERFNDENKHKIKPFTYNPFGYGPRTCIGSHFALTEIKTIFFHLLSTFHIELAKETKVPIKICKKNFNLGVKDGIRLQLRRRNYYA